MRIGWVAVFLVVSGCGSSAGDEGPAPPTGSGSIHGTVGGKPFDTVGASYAIGQSDDPARTTVVYVFDRAIACAELGSPGWDARIADGTQVVEMKLIGKAPATYPVVSGATAGDGQASANYTLSSTKGTPMEISSTAG